MSRVTPGISVAADGSDTAGVGATEGVGPEQADAVQASARVQPITAGRSKVGGRIGSEFPPVVVLTKCRSRRFRIQAMHVARPARFASPRTLAALSIAAVPILLLGPFVQLDPVPGVTSSNAPYTDEGWNLIGARSLALFGRPPADEWQAWLLTLPFTGLQAVALNLFGVEIEVARWVIVLTVAMTGAAISWTLASAVGTRNAWLAGLAYVTSALVLYYGRLAFLEPMVGGFLAVGVLSLAPASRGAAGRYGVLAGAAFALAVMTKAHAAAAVVAVLVVALFAATSMPAVRRWLFGSVLTGGAIAVIWTATVLLPHAQDVALVIGEIYPDYRWPNDVIALLRTVLAWPFRDGVLWLAWPIVGLAAVGTVATLTSIRRRGWRPADLAPIAAAAGLVAGAGLVSVVGYQPNRYIVAFLPLAAIAGAWVVPRGRLRGSRGWAAMALAMVLIAGHGVALHIGWMRAARTELGTMQAAAERQIEPGAILVGTYAPLVALGIPVEAIVPFGQAVNEENWYQRGARYAIWQAGRDWMSEASIPQEDRHEVACMIWAQDAERVCLYELADPS